MTTLIKFLSIFSIILTNYFGNTTNSFDGNGYILYCPCMGRFGNQADHFLGALSFAKALNRTLVLPPWVEYVPLQPKSIQVPFDSYFKVSPLLKYHRVMLMHEFMRDIAPSLWPPENRTVLCYMARFNSEGCNAKGGNPFGPFWDHFNVDFTNSSFYGPLSHSVQNSKTSLLWREKYPKDTWPVLAFTGAPAAFPVQRENIHLHKYLEWNEGVQRKAKELMRSFPQGPVVGIHLRNGVDWERACEHTKNSPNLFAAPQCLGYMNEHGRATEELCLPSHSTIVRQLKRTVKKLKARTVYVASDSNFMREELTNALHKLKVSVVPSDGESPHLDLAVLGKADHFIGNCISSFSAFVKRERDVKGVPSSFFAFPSRQPKMGSQRQEL